MSTNYERPLVAEMRHELTALRGNWLWFVVIGVVLIVLGFIALGSQVIASLATAVVIGVLMLIGGVSETIGAFWCGAGAASSCTFCLASFRWSLGYCSCEHRSMPCSP